MLFPPAREYMATDLIVSASGIRGIVGTGLTEHRAERYGAAFGRFLSAAGGAGHVILGRDSRVSGPAMASAASAGLRGGGLDVVDVGVVPTPTGLLACQDDPSAVGALLVTASHNPVEWNGLKLAGRQGEFLSPEEGLQVQRLYESDSAETPASPASGRQTERLDAIEAHLSRIGDLSLVEPDRIGGRRLTVAVDCVRGAGGRIMPQLLERLGCQVIGLDLEPDGHFPRNPEPTVANLGALSAAVSGSDADLGLAVDPDVDRLALVDGNGVAIGEDWTLALVVDLVLSHTPGPVVTNLSTSLCVADSADRAGQPFHRSPVGEANVARRMLEVGAVIGGEGNGGVMLPELHLTRDAPLAAALILQLLAERETTLEALIAARPGYHSAKSRIPRPAGELEDAYALIVRSLGDGATEDRQDGLFLEWPDRRWLHVRPSGTEPILRVMAEAPDESEALRLAGETVRMLSALGEGTA